MFRIYFIREEKQQVSILARQVNPGHVQEYMKSCEEATKRPHGYFMLDLKPTTVDQHRLKSNVLPDENIAGQQNLDHYTRKRSYQQPPILNGKLLQLGSTDETNCTSTAPDTICQDHPLL